MPKEEWAKVAPLNNSSTNFSICPGAPILCRHFIDENKFINSKTTLFSVASF